MSVEYYYAKLERGALGGVSAGVLDAIARALQLDDAERRHLFHLAQAADGTAAAMRPRRRGPAQWAAQPSLQWALDSITCAQHGRSQPVMAIPPLTGFWTPTHAAVLGPPAAMASAPL